LSPLVLTVATNPVVASGSPVTLSVVATGSTVSVGFGTSCITQTGFVPTNNYNWVQTGGPKALAISGQTTSTMSFTAPMAGNGTQIMTFLVSALDTNNVRSSPVTATVTVQG
jgi:hypothetical protein